MDAILLGIDGTGELSDEDYERSFRNSFVSYIHRHTPAKIKHYMRGPAFEGLDMFAISRKGYEFVHLNRIVHPKARVLLVGYSRGAAGVVEVAKFLARDGVTVDAMMLFDPVDRSPTSDADEVPRNVRELCIARRMYDTFSRASFNNCANIWHKPPTNCLKKHFWATHGGLGGVPWKPEPGQSEYDYVSEGLSEIALMRAVYGVAGISWVPEPGDKRTQDEFLLQRELAGNQTRVTFHDDMEGAREVWHWCEPWLRENSLIAQ